MTVTANTIIGDAMREIGAIGTSDTPEPEDSAHALRVMNRMLDGWMARTLYAFHTDWQVVTLTSAMQTRTIGSGGQINTTRPVRVETGSFTVVSGVSKELKVASRDQWANIPTKTLVGERPEWVYYEAASPLGTLHFWPQAACELNLALQTVLTAFADLTTAYTLPPGHEEAIVLSLAEKLCRVFSRPITGDLKNAARAARAAIKLANFQVPELAMPTGHARGSLAEFQAG